MRIFDFLSKSEISEGISFPWIALTTVNQLDEIQKNKNEVCAIFKHSTRCGISRSVLSKYEKSKIGNLEGIKYYYLDLLNYRELSNEIASRFKVIHQSPQLLIIEKGVVVEHASHYEILE
ncbi:MAG: bacillithiol system redox-active protein YtxJ [Bacteroidetes bacterium]|nr:bacillithiol system redox-active protein YtxJ [Bacteroidota bacterium]